MPTDRVIMNDGYEVTFTVVYWPGVIVTAAILVLGFVAFVGWKRHRRQ